LLKYQATSQRGSSEHQWPFEPLCCVRWSSKAKNQMCLLAFKKANNTIQFFYFFLGSGGSFFTFSHRSQKYINNLGYKPTYSNPK